MKGCSSKIVKLNTYYPRRVMAQREHFIKSCLIIYIFNVFEPRGIITDRWHNNNIRLR